jgi:predicted nicotinamide N-methyase
MGLTPEDACSIIENFEFLAKRLSRGEESDLVMVADLLFEKARDGNELLVKGIFDLLSSIGNAVVINRLADLFNERFLEMPFENRLEIFDLTTHALRDYIFKKRVTLDES